jgi:HAE1 family hydrophobic/amphiphilic exporter-1
LWRGLRYDANRHQIQVAKKNKSLSDEQFRQKVSDIVTQAAGAYWDLDYAVRDYQSQLDAVRLAGQQKESNIRQMQQGVLAKIDVVAAETQVATFEQQFYQAQEILTRAENALKQLMAGGHVDGLWSTALIPTTKVNTEYAVGTLDEEIAAGLKKRPEIAQARISTEVNELDTKLYKDQTKPQLDFVGQFSTSGLAGPLAPPAPNPITGSFAPLINRLNDLSTIAGLPPVVLSTGTSAPALLIGGYGQSLNNLTGGVYPTVSLGVQMSLPIRNRTANANLSVSVAQGKVLKNQQEVVQMAVVSDVRSSVQGLAAAEARFRAASRARDSAEEQYASEQRQFKAGTSTLFLVLQRQTDMITARSRELRAQADVGRSIADLERATGEVLEKQKIELK